MERRNYCMKNVKLEYYSAFCKSLLIINNYYKLISSRFEWIYSSLTKSVVWSWNMLAALSFILSSRYSFMYAFYSLEFIY